MEPHVSSVRQGAFNPLLSPEDWVSQLSWATHWASESEWNKDNPVLYHFVWVDNTLFFNVFLKSEDGDGGWG